MIKKPSIREQVLSLLSGKFIALILQFLIPMALVRLISKEDYGIYQQINLVINFFGPIFLFGIASSFYYFYPTANKNKKKQLLSQSFLISLFLASCFLFLFLIFDDYVHYVISSFNIYDYLIPTGLTVFFYIINYPIEHLFVVEEKSKNVIAFLIINSLVRGIFIIVPIILFNNIIIVIWALCIFNLLKSIYYYYYIVVNYGLDLRFYKWDKTYLVKQFEYTYPLGLSQMVSVISSKIDSFILASNFSSADFATYSVAKFRIPIIGLIFPSISNVIGPKITICGKNNDLSGATILWHKIIVALSRIVIPVTFFFIITATELITFLYTKNYVEAVFPYRIILLTFFAQMLSRGVVINAFGFTKYLFKIQLVSMIFSVVIAFVLIPNYGVIGAAITYVIAFYFSAFLQLYKVKSILQLSFFNWFPYNHILKIFFVSFIPSVLIYFLKYINIPLFIYLVISTIVFFTTTALLLLYTGEIKKQDLINMKKIFLKKLSL